VPYTINHDLTINGNLTVTGATTAVVDFVATGDVQLGDAFTDIIDVQGILKIADGTLADLALRFKADEDNGIYRIGTDNWALAVGGIQVLALNVPQAGDVQAIIDVGLTGTSTYPSLAFGDGDTGWYQSSDDLLVLAISGSAKIYHGTSNFADQTTGAFRIDFGAASSTVPVFTFWGDNDTGIGRAAADSLSLIAGGVEGIRIVENTTIQALFSNGTASLPSISFINDVNTGIYKAGSDNEMDFSNGGARTFALNAGRFYSIQTNGPSIQNENATATNPVFTISSDQDTGIGWAEEDSLSLIAGNVELLRLVEGATDYLRIPNSIYIAAVDNAGTGIINMFQVNSDDEIDVGATLNIGTLEFPEDAGIVTAMNMPVSSTPSDGDEMSYTFRIDSNNILKVKASADGAGGADELQIQSYGGRIENVTTVNAATYDLLAGDYILNVTYTVTAAVTSLTLPTAQVVEGRVVIIKDAGGNASANNITIDTEGAETIDGSATLVMSSDYEWVTLYSDGSNWFVIG